jgi:hypothetical protein
MFLAPVQFPSMTAPLPGLLRHAVYALHNFVIAHLDVLLLGKTVE